MLISLIKLNIMNQNDNITISAHTTQSKMDQLINLTCSHVIQKGYPPKGVKGKKYYLLISEYEDLIHYDIFDDRHDLSETMKIYACGGSKFYSCRVFFAPDNIGYATMWNSNPQTSEYQIEIYNQFPQLVDIILKFISQNVA
jgi:hypothetical protein